MINLKIHPRCLERIEHWTDVAPGEFSALGVVQKNGESLIVPELYLPQQTCDEASTEMDPDDRADAVHVLLVLLDAILVVVIVV